MGFYSPQVEGSKVSSELPGILDEVISITTIQGGVRKFVCQTINPDSYPVRTVAENSMFLRMRIWANYSGKSRDRPKKLTSLAISNKQLNEPKVGCQSNFYQKENKNDQFRTPDRLQQRGYFRWYSGSNSTKHNCQSHHEHQKRRL